MLRGRSSLPADGRARERDFEGLRFFLDGSPVSVASAGSYSALQVRVSRHCGPFFELVDQQFELLDLRLEFFRRAAEAGCQRG